MIFYQGYKDKWAFSEKLLFRAVFTYFILYILLLFFAILIEVPLRWFAENVLNWGANFKTASTGSGDRTFDYVRLVFNIFLAIPTVLLWSILDKKKQSYNKLFYWFQIVIRSVLIVVMLLYGLAKLFKGQFADPSLELLLQNVGDMSPMGLAWTFMGHSMAYNIFIGFIEILGGILLLYRKTVTAGSVLIFGVMSNVAIMNLTYDIPVKLFSLHLVAMAFLLIVIDSHRIIQVFLRNKAVHTITFFRPSLNIILEKIILGGKVLIIALLGLTVVIQCFVRFDMKDQLKEKSEFYGIWESQLFIKNNDTLLPLVTDTFQWRYLIVNYKREAVVKKMNDSIDRYHFEYNKSNSTISLRRKKDSALYLFSYKFTSPEGFQLKGMYGDDSLYIKFKKKLETDFKLINRKFHWINESTYNY